MKTRTTVFTGPRALDVREMELPPLGPRQVLVKVRACALCTWEQRFYLGSSPQDYPFRGGHEAAGVVVARGPEALCEAQVGDRAAFAIMTRCGVCEACRRGMDNFCENDKGGTLPGQPWGPGGLSEYLILEDYQVYRATPEADFAALALSEPVACVLRSVTAPPLEFGDTVLVQGVGIMGLLHVLLLKQRGVRVVVSDPNPARRQVAARYGTTLTVDPLADDFATQMRALTHGRGFNAIFFTAGGGPAIEQALPLLAKRGWLCLYGSVHPKGTVPVDPNVIHYNEQVITGSFSHTKKSFMEAVTLLSHGLLDTTPFISERVPFPEVTYAFERAVSPDTYRVVVEFAE